MSPGFEQSTGWRLGARNFVCGIPVGKSHELFAWQKEQRLLICWGLEEGDRALNIQKPIYWSRTKFKRSASVRYPSDANLKRVWIQLKLYGTRDVWSLLLFWAFQFLGAQFEQYHAQTEIQWDLTGSWCLPSKNASQRLQDIPGNQFWKLATKTFHQLQSPSPDLLEAPSMKVTPSGTLAGKPPDKSSSARTVIPRSRQCLPVKTQGMTGIGLRESRGCSRHTKSPFQPLFPKEFQIQQNTFYFWMSWVAHHQPTNSLNCLATWLPMKPAAPVTSTVLPRAKATSWRGDWRYRWSRVYKNMEQPENQKSIGKVHLLQIIFKPMKFNACFSLPEGTDGQSSLLKLLNANLPRTWILETLPSARMGLSKRMYPEINKWFINVPSQIVKFGHAPFSDTPESYQVGYVKLYSVFPLLTKLIQ